MTADRYVDPSLEDAFMGWMVWAPTPLLAPWFARLQPNLVTDGRRRVMLEAVRDNFAATGQNDPAVIYQRLRAEGADIHAGVLQQWSDAYAGCPGSGYGLLEALEDLARQRAARGVRETAPGPTGRASVEAISAALATVADPPSVAALTIAEVGRRALHALDDPRPRSLHSGLATLDQSLGGFLPGQLVIVGGRTGAGKSVFGLRLGRGLAEQAGRPCHIHALEMTTDELVARLAADRASVENWKIQHGRLEADERDRVGRAYAEMRASSALHLRDLRGGSCFPQAMAAYEAWLAQHPDAVALVVDYLGLYRDIPGAERRYQELGIVAHALKALAGRYGVVVIAVSQLSRAAAQDASPQLHHLRESGDLEQDADVVLLLDAPYADTLDVHIAKCRSGVAGDVVRLGFDRRYCRIEDAI